MPNRSVRHEKRSRIESNTNLGIVLCIPGMESDGFEVVATVEVDSHDNVLEGGYDTLNCGNVLLFEDKWVGVAGTAVVGGWKVQQHGIAALVDEVQADAVHGDLGLVHGGELWDGYGSHLVFVDWTRLR
jgi:hypothetical protein